MLFVRSALAVLVLSAVGCSARGNNFGGPPDAGDASGDAGDMSREAGGVSAAVGESCFGPNDCVSDALCIGNASGGFVCMQSCQTPYALCPSGEVCLPVMTQDAAICFLGGAATKSEACANNLDCAPGLLCLGAGSEFYCRPACDDEDACEANELCLRLPSGAGLCRTAIGAACIVDSDCRVPLSCSSSSPQLAPAFPGGYCTNECTRDSDCATDAVCRQVVGTTDPVCLTRCTGRSECRFNGDYDCADAGICAASTDPGACQAMFGDDSLCVPGPF